jgi:hypothetical protein
VPEFGSFLWASKEKNGLISITRLRLKATPEQDVGQNEGKADDRFYEYNTWPLPIICLASVRMKTDYRDKGALPT